MNGLNQYTNRDVPGYIEIQGAADSNSTVTVNGQTAYRKGEYYRTEVTVNNSSTLAYQAITNQAALTPDTVTFNRHALVAATPEAFTQGFRPITSPAKHASRFQEFVKIRWLPLSHSPAASLQANGPVQPALFTSAPASSFAKKSSLPTSPKVS